MSETAKIVLTVVGSVVGSVLASSGFWTYLNKRKCSDTAERELLKGLAHDRILYLANQYLERGDWIIASEYENLKKYLYEPYAACDGNGTAGKAMKDVDEKLMIVKDAPYAYQKAKEEMRAKNGYAFSHFTGVQAG